MTNILLIEPDRVLAAIYYQSLTNEGYQVSVAPGAQSAIMAADRSQPDLIILDLQLVDHSGIEFLYEFKSYSEWQDAKVIIHSHIPPAEFSSSAAILREQLGMIEYLYKPHTSLEQLVGSVSSALEPAKT